MRHKGISFIVGLLVVAGIVALSVHAYLAAQTGTVSVSLNTAQQSTGTIEFNHQAIAPEQRSSTQSIYRLHKGRYLMTVVAVGYKPFSANFLINKGDQLHVKVNLQLASDPTLSQANQIPGLTLPGLTITNIKYFYGKTWAVFLVHLAGTDPAFAVAKYDPANASWSLAAGPGTYFTADSLRGIPDQVSGYLLSQE